MPTKRHLTLVIALAAGIAGAVVGGSAVALAAGTPAPAPATAPADPIKSDGDKYSAIFENDRVRVLKYDDKPGAKTTLHHHPDFVLYALEPFKRKLTFADGHSVVKELKKGDVIFMPAQDHIGENIGDADTHVLIVELKQPAGAK